MTISLRTIIDSCRNEEWDEGELCLLIMQTSQSTSSHHRCVAQERVLRFLTSNTNQTILKCPWSWRLTTEDDAVTISNGDRISEGGFDEHGNTCDDCGEMGHAEDFEQADNGKTICDNCRDNNYFTCDDCTGLFQTRYSHDYDGSCYCPDCYNNLNMDDDDDAPYPGNHVLSYSTNILSRLTTSALFKTAPGEHRPKEPLWLGVELEVERKRKCPSDITTLVHQAVSSFAILKEDGSLSSSGFEIVTIPATLEYHRLAWKPYFAGPANHLLSFKTNTCGMHVHVSRAAMSTLQLGKLLVFINDTKNAPFINAVAGRDRSTYATRSPKKITSGKATYSDHFDAVAISRRNDGKTVEIRIFKGNTTLNGFFKNLEFVVAVVSFCATTGNRNLDSKDFIKFMDLPSSRASWPILTKWMGKHSYLKVSAPAPLNEAAE